MLFLICVILPGIVTLSAWGVSLYQRWQGYREVKQARQKLPMVEQELERRRAELKVLEHALFEGETHVPGLSLQASEVREKISELSSERRGLVLDLREAAITGGRGGAMVWLMVVKTSAIYGIILFLYHLNVHWLFTVIPSLLYIAVNWIFLYAPILVPLEWIVNALNRRSNRDK